MCIKLRYLLICLLLTSKALGQDYYQKPKQSHLIVSAGANWQYLSPVFKWATFNTQNTSANLQIGISYNLPLKEENKGLSLNPKIVLRTNNAGLIYQTPIGDTFIRNSHGYSSQFLLPVKYRYREFALSVGLFMELPISLSVKEEVNQAGTTDWLPNIDRRITQMGKGWQLSAEYNRKCLQLRLFVANRSAINQDQFMLLPSLQIRGGSIGYKF